MHRIITKTLCVALLVISLCVSFAQNPAETKAKSAVGIVFDDRNQNGKMDTNEKGIQGVCVSNGVQVVATDAIGKYSLPVNDNTIIFVIKPAGWKVPTGTDHFPKFYYIHKPNGSQTVEYPGVPPTGELPAAINFPLNRSDESNRFKAIFLGDPQNPSDRTIAFFLHDIVEDINGTDALFTATLGDNGANKLDVFPNLKQAYSQLGTPMYITLGNHDENFDSPDDKHSTETFQRYFGPNYYSYNYGMVHFIVMDDVFWTGRTAEKQGTYKARMSGEQLEFIKNDLKYVSRKNLVVLMMHIPIRQIENKTDLFALIEPYPHNLSISAHEHQQKHWFLGPKDGWNGAKPHHHLINGTSCGCWWGGQTDEVGIPHAIMSDGTPNGYTIASFNGNEYSMEYKVARKPADYQMNIYTPDFVQSVDAATTDVIVNVFFGNKRSQVMMSFDNPTSWVAMERTVMEDPYVVALYEGTKAAKPTQTGSMVAPVKSEHIWKAALPANPAEGLHMIYVKTTDMFGHTYLQKRVLRIVNRYSSF